MSNENKPVSRPKAFTVAGTAFMFDAMDVGIISYIAAALIVEWNLTSVQAGWIGSVNSIGMLVGAMAAGVLADRIGRNKVLMYTVLLFAVASGLSALATSFAVLLFLRFFIGLGLGGEAPVAAAFVAEHFPKKSSGRMVVLLESFWALGWLLAASIGYFIIPEWGWRAALVLGATPAFLALYMRRALPDSPTFQKVDAKKFSAWNGIKKLWSLNYRRSTFMLWILWFFTFFSYYGIVLWLPSILILQGYDLIQSFGYVLIMTLAQLPGFLSAAYLIEKIGRKPVMVVYLIGTAISAYFFGTAGSVASVIVSGLALNYFFPGITGTIYAYTNEHYEPEIRGTGAGMSNAMGRLGSVFGPVFVGFLVAANITYNVIFAIFFVTLFIAALNILILGKETRIPEHSESDEEWEGFRVSQQKGQDTGTSLSDVSIRRK